MNRNLCCAVLLCLGLATILPASSEHSSGPRAGFEEQRIIHGTAVPMGAYPWVAGLVSADEEDPTGGQLCGGALIHPRWVLTAAHCVEGMAPSEIDVVLGHRDLGSNELIRLPVMDIILHPEFDPFILDADLALLLIPAVAEIGGIDPIEVVDNDNFEAPGTLARVLGWGEIDRDGNSPGLLQMADVPIVLNSQAGAGYGIITDRMLLAGVASGGPNTCSGDSGGPLIVSDGASAWLLAGVTSFGRNDIDCDAPDNYGAYTRLSHFTDWIATMLRPHQTAWEADYGVAADDSDIDGDGLTGFGEFAFGTDPGIPDRPGTARSPFLSIRTLNSYEVTTTLARSVDLQNWEMQFIPSTMPNPPIMRPWQSRNYTGFWVFDFPASGGSFFQLEARPSLDYNPPAHQIPLGGHALTRRNRHYSETRQIAGFEPPLANEGPPTSYPLFEVIENGYFMIEHPAGIAADGTWHLSVRSAAFEPKVDFPPSHQTILFPGTAAELEPIGSEILSSGPDHRLLAIELDPRADKYPIVISATDPDATGDYRVALFRPYTVGMALSPTGIHTGVLSSSDDTHRISETGYSYHDLYGLGGFAAEEFVTVVMDSTSIDPTLQMVDLETGRVLFGSDDGYATGLRSFLEFVVPEGGIADHVALRAGAAEADSLGVYSFTISRGARLPVGASTTSAALASSDPIDENFTSEDYYRDDYLLSGFTPGSEVIITMQGSSIDAYLYVFDAHSRNTLVTADEFGDGKAETLRFTPAAGHQYIIRATTYNARETGSYTIRAD